MSIKVIAHTVLTPTSHCCHSSSETLRLYCCRCLIFFGMAAQGKPSEPGIYRIRLLEHSPNLYMELVPDKGNPWINLTNLNASEKKQQVRTMAELYTCLKTLKIILIR